ncbi:MAG: mechanosensitive ion channel family protein [Flavobacteriaceae bacterium]|jgi:miniconductance mechanosensitive channel|nr:mechanosensitive ion channel family protein [Flavobacteriaceae bacterium]
MEDNLSDTKDFLQQISDWIRFFVKDSISDDWKVQFFFKFLFWAAMIYAIDLIVKILINFGFKFVSDKKKYPILVSLRKAKITNSIAHLFALSFASFSLYSIFYIHTKSYPILERIVEFVFVLVFGGIAFRLLKTVEYYYSIKEDYYRLVALRAISQTVKVLGIFIFSVIGIAVIFGIDSGTILGSLGAIMAILVLIFRDTIMGFVTGIHVATSKNLKEGDWIGIPKYNLEGIIEEINLLTTKIRNFDKTVSTIPTYDLLSTEIRNLQIMSETNRRRIKKSMIFNIKSFHFLSDEDIGKLEKINLIRDYLVEEKRKMDAEKGNIENADELINRSQLTNIGTFRIYALNYLKNCPNIVNDETLLVRQLDITYQGFPLEIYCFTNSSKSEDYERIQSDIFDHLLVASREFDLEIMQVM